VATELLARGSPHGRAEAGQILNLGHETARFLQLRGVGDVTLGRSREFLGKVVELAVELRLDRIEAVRGFLGDLAACDHAASAVIVTAILAVPRGAQFSRVHRLIGLTALLHDVGLHHLGIEPEIEDWRLVEPSQAEAFHRHPTERSQEPLGAFHFEADLAEGRSQNVVLLIAGFQVGLEGGGTAGREGFLENLDPMSKGIRSQVRQRAFRTNVQKLLFEGGHGAVQKGFYLHQSGSLVILCKSVWYRNLNVTQASPLFKPYHFHVAEIYFSYYVDQDLHPNYFALV
jgi:hypothetical protein